MEDRRRGEKIEMEARIRPYSSLNQLPSTAWSTAPPVQQWFGGVCSAQEQGSGQH